MASITAPSRALAATIGGFTLVAVASLVVCLASAVGLLSATNAMVFRPLLSDSPATILVVRLSPKRAS